MVNRIVHSDPTCRVCRQLSPGLVVTAAPIPPPFPNPEAKHSTFNAPAYSGTEGGAQGNHWYHGTTFDPQVDPEDKNADNGGTLRAPDLDAEGSRRGKHWNTDLGIHFTSIHNVAHSFANNKNDLDARIAHAHLHMQNPVRYKDEEAFANHAINWALSRGHKHLPENHEGQRAFLHGDYIGVEHNDPKGRFYGYNDELGSHKESRQATIDIDKHGPSATSELEYKERWLGRHPDRSTITEGFKNHLRSQGHDGVIYGNSYEGPYLHKSAVVFPETPVSIHHWEWLHPNHEEHESRSPEDPNQRKLFGRKKTAQGDWTFQHYQPGGSARRLIGGPADNPTAHLMEYRVTPDKKIRFDQDTLGLDRIQRKHGPEAAQRMRDAAMAEHPDHAEYDPVADAPAPEKPPRRVYYHGTTVEGVTHVLPADHHGQGTVFPQETDKSYAYATPNLKDAWDYAQKAWDHTGGGKTPRVYQVRPIGGHQHVEKDPQYTEGTQPMLRGNNADDVRSKKGFEVVKEMAWPKHMGDLKDYEESW